jgi:hypothetical protein
MPDPKTHECVVEPAVLPANRALFVWACCLIIHNIANLDQLLHLQILLQRKASSPRTAIATSTMNRISAAVTFRTFIKEYHWGLLDTGRLNTSYTAFLAASIPNRRSFLSCSTIGTLPRLSFLVCFLTCCPLYQRQGRIRTLFFCQYVLVTF